MTLERFLRYRYVAMLAWCALLVAAPCVASAVGQRLPAGAPRVLAWWAVVGATVGLGLLAQRQLLARIDPDGRLRDEVRRQAGGRG